MTDAIYASGEYLERNPTWHEPHSAWKAERLAELLARNDVRPARIADVGCGVGRVLAELVAHFPEARGTGYDVAPYAVAEATRRFASARLDYRHADPFEGDDRFDLAMAIDVFEHVDDYIGFLRRIRPLAEWKAFHIPLDLSVQTVLRRGPLRQARRDLGHLHSFNRDSALASLEHAGHEVVDWSYTFASTALDPSTLKRPGMKRLASVPRRLMQALSEDLAAHLLGGGAMMVLTR